MFDDNNLDCFPFNSVIYIDNVFVLFAEQFSTGVQRCANEK